MPIYEYYCEKCDVQVEILQKFSAKKTIMCPECGRPIRRIISRIGGFIFKGPGFYATDYQGK